MSKLEQVKKYTVEEEETIERMKAANPAFYDMLFAKKSDGKHNVNDGRRCIVGEFHGLDK